MMKEELKNALTLLKAAGLHSPEIEAALIEGKGDFESLGKQRLEALRAATIEAQKENLIKEAKEEATKQANAHVWENAEKELAQALGLDLAKYANETKGRYKKLVADGKAQYEQAQAKLKEEIDTLKKNNPDVGALSRLNEQLNTASQQLAELKKFKEEEHPKLITAEVGKIQKQYKVKEFVDGYLDKLSGKFFGNKEVIRGLLTNSVAIDFEETEQGVKTLIKDPKTGNLFQKTPTENYGPDNFEELIIEKVLKPNNLFNEKPTPSAPPIYSLGNNNGDGTPIMHPNAMNSLKQ